MSKVEMKKVRVACFESTQEYQLDNSFNGSPTWVRNTNWQTLTDQINNFLEQNNATPVSVSSPTVTVVTDGDKRTYILNCSVIYELNVDSIPIPTDVAVKLLSSKR